MRLIGFFEKENIARRFSHFLEKEKIENSIEIINDPKSKKDIFNIWVSNEDLFAKAEQYYEEFKQDPENVKYDSLIIEHAINEQDKKDSESIISDPAIIRKQHPFRVTLFFVFICVAIFLLDLFQSQSILKKYDLKDEIIFSPVQNAFLYDVPKIRSQIDDVIIRYGLKTQKDLQDPSPAVKEELQKIEKEPTWIGFYEIILQKLQNHKNEIKPLLFEKISEGQVWRLFTPVLLHAGFLHIIFNMIWFWYLGKQIEPRLGALRYLLLIIIVAIVSNTFQYLMGGPYFLGLSGVITGMFGYVFIRQKIAPWEGYTIPNILFYFFAIYIFMLALLDLSSFLFQIFKPELNFNPGIANTAHIVGAVTGMILAKIPFFSWGKNER
ncbi:MAG: rhomboid family intramembrane serine protease [Parachlamydiales bacterium]|jgi:GlpG protein